MIEINQLTRLDNDNEYFSFVISAISHSDPYAKVTLSKNNTHIAVSIIPSDKALRQGIINNLLEVNRRFGITIHFSKSLKIQKRIYYNFEYSTN